MIARRIGCCSKACSTPCIVQRCDIRLVIEIRLNLLLLIVTAISTWAKSFPLTWFRSYPSLIFTASSPNSCLPEWAGLGVLRDLFDVRWKSRLLKNLAFIVLVLQFPCVISTDSLDFWCISPNDRTIFLPYTPANRSFAFVVDWPITWWNTRTTLAHTERIYQDILRLVHRFLVCTSC